MPKGQYVRKPRIIGAEAVLVPAPHPDDTVIGAPVTVDPVPEHDAEVQRMAVLLSEPIVPMPAVPTRETFDEWLDADITPLPANDRITVMVGEWAAAICPGEHSVTWLPSLDRQKLTVTLITPHGTSDLASDAGQWTEADIAAALADMRRQLGV